jgi:hypothetical protein
LPWGRSCSFWRVPAEQSFCSIYFWRKIEKENAHLLLLSFRRGGVSIDGWRPSKQSKKEKKRDDGLCLYKVYKKNRKSLNVSFEQPFSCIK